MKYKLNFFVKYSRHIRYILFFLTIILMVTSIKVYLNDSNIAKSIQEELEEEQDLQQKNYFEKNFYLTYLSWSDWWIKYADFFMRHDNRVVKDQEQIIEFSIFEEWILTGNTTTWWASQEEIIEINDPKDAWNYFLWLKIKKFNTNL